MKIKKSLSIGHALSLIILSTLNSLFLKYFPNNILTSLSLSFILTYLFSEIVRGILLKKFLFKPLSDIEKILTSLSEGNLDEDPISAPQNEVGEIAHKLNFVIGNFENIIHNIYDVSGKLSRNSESLDINLHNIIKSDSDESIKAIKESMDSIVVMVTTQTAETEEIFASLTQISSMIGSVSHSLDKTKVLSNETREFAKMGEKSVAESLAGMLDIQDTVKNIEEKANILGKSSTEVGKIVEIISGISEQTNLLALNAAIEAARAGEAGKGFAVVAEEVRKLAENSKVSTQQIVNLVNTIQREVSEVVTAVNRGYEKAQYGTSLAEDTSENIGKIIRQIEVTDEMMQEIATLMKEQSLATNEINNTMEKIATNSTEINNVSMIHNESLEYVTSLLDSSLNNTKVISVVSDALNNLIRTFTINSTKQASEIDALPWKRKYSVHIDSIDEQHKELVKLMNKLNNAMLYEKGRTEIAKILEGLVDYTVFHFDYEEQMMKQCNYPDFDNHKKIHLELVNTVQEFKKDFDSGKKELSKDVMEFLKSWLIDHIIGTDQKYSKLMQENSIK